MNLASVMDAVSTAVDTIPGLRVFGYYVDRVVPPAAIVAWPESLTFDATMRRGADQMTIPLIIAVGRATERSTRDALAAYCDGDAPGGVKHAVETFQTTVYDSIRVTSIEFGTVTIAGVGYLSATFNIQVTG